MKKSQTAYVRYGGSAIFRIPAEIRQDSSYPFKLGDKLVIEIEKDQITIRKPKKNETL